MAHIFLVPLIGQMQADLCEVQDNQDYKAKHWVLAVVYKVTHWIAHARGSDCAVGSATTPGRHPEEAGPSPKHPHQSSRTMSLGPPTASLNSQSLDSANITQIRKAITLLSPTHILSFKVSLYFGGIMRM